LKTNQKRRSHLSAAFFPKPVVNEKLLQKMLQRISIEMLCVID
jgi:hypothetical protein